MKGTAISITLAVVVLFPLLMVLAVADVGGITQATACTPATSAGSSGSPGSAAAPSTGAGAFGIGTLNWRGASHYGSDPHRGERPYATRVPYMVDKVNAAGASIIGFQEFEPPQARAFAQATRGQWAIVPGRVGQVPGRGHPDSRDAIAYQPAVWTPAETRYVPIDYGGNTVWLPLARFSSTRGLGDVWVLNTHNPANVVHGNNTMRDQAVRAEAGVLRQLQTTQPDVPLFMTGDMNDRTRFKHLFLTWAGPGWSTANPDDHQIDWIMGGPGVAFSDTIVDKTTNDGGHDYTDHPFVHTSVAFTAPSPAASPGTSQPSPHDIPGQGHPVVTTEMDRRGQGLTPDAGGHVVIGQWTLNADQAYNAEAMVAAAVARAGTGAALVIVSAALAESGLATDPGSTGGAYGVLQMTPSAGWGTQAQVTNVTYATATFLDHLAYVPDWRSKQPWEAAQAVERSAAGDPTSAYYQAHHLTWGYGGNYRRHLPETTAIVTAITGAGGLVEPNGGIVPVAAFCPSGVDEGGGVDVTGATGHGDLTPNTQFAYVGPYPLATLRSRMGQIMARNGSRENLDPFFGTEPDGSWYHDCQHFVANLDGRSSSGYTTAASAWAHFLATGAGHPAGSGDGMSPPVGAWLYFSPNHVVVYLGDNLVAGTDTWGTGTAKVGPVSDITHGRWHLGYLGWVTPWGIPATTATGPVGA